MKRSILIAIAIFIVSFSYAGYLSVYSLAYTPTMVSDWDRVTVEDTITSIFYGHYDMTSNAPSAWAYAAFYVAPNQWEGQGRALAYNGGPALDDDFEPYEVVNKYVYEISIVAKARVYSYGGLWVYYCHSACTVTW